MSQKNKLPVFLALALVLTLFTFQNCSSQKFDSNGAPIYVVENPSNILTMQATTIQWRYTSGALPPSFQYEVIYKVDFQSKNLIISVVSGSAVNGMPAAKTAILTDAQLLQIRTLFDKITYGSCPAGPGIVGGGTNEISIFTTSQTAADAFVYLTDCPYGSTGTNLYLNSFGFQNLTNYLKTL